MRAKIFANPDLPQLDDYYEPFDFDYQHLHEAPEGKHQPTARPPSLISGQRMEKIHWGPNPEETLGTELAKLYTHRNLESEPEEISSLYKATIMMYMKRKIEHN